MTGTTISTSGSVGLELSDADQNPVTITSAGTINSPGNYGIFADDGVAWNITNYGLVSAGLPNSTGINFITDTLGVTLTNAGTIAAGYSAVWFGSGDNLLVIDPGAVFAGYVYGGSGGNNTLALASAATTGTLAGLSSKYGHFQYVTVAAGANWTFNSTDTVGAGVVLTNAGTLGTPGVSSLYFAGGTLTNQATGTISGFSLYVLPGNNGSIDNAGLINDTYGVKLGDGGTVTNFGTIKGDAASFSSYGVYSRHGGTIVNGASGVTTALIEGYTGIRVVGGSGATYNGYVTNFGSVMAEGTSNVGILLEQGGTVTNGSSTDTTALVQGGRWGVSASAGTVTNYGTINATYNGGGGVGVFMQGQVEYINNFGSNALIEGYYGVSVSYGTIINFGTIASTVGNAGTAVLFNAGYNRIIIEPGAKFIGIVEGGAVDGGAIELAGTAADTFSGLGSSFINFGTVDIDPGSSWSLAGANTIAAGSTFDVAGSLGIAGVITNAAGFILDGGTISLASPSDVDSGSTFDFVAGLTTHPTLIFNGVGDGDSITTAIDDFAGRVTIDLPALSFVAGASTTISSNTMVVVSNGATVDLAVTGLTDGTPYFTTHDSGGGTEIIACFVAGTRIRTRSGEVAVEALRVGDSVSTHAGPELAVRWIGWRSHAAETVAANPHLRPVRIRAHALAAGVPARDLLVSPSHALLVDGVLIPAGALVNGVSILRDPVGAIAYFHIELDHHDVLLAEGAPAESFFDLAGREMFDNAADYIAPVGKNFASCLPRIEEGAVVQAARRRIAARAGIAIALFSAGLLRGHVERIVASDDGTARTIEGWVLDEAAPNEPVELDIITETGLRLRLSANRYRADLDRAGLAGGRCGFSVRLPGRGPVLVQRAADGAALPMSG